MSLSVSVIICTHNPSTDYLRRTLEGLRGQTLSRQAWSLLVVDNSSNPPLQMDLAWHPKARLVREEELGLTPARLRGFREAPADLTVCVDDDNVLDRHYLQYAVEIAETMPFVAAWSGQQIPEFEVEPHPGLRGWMFLLALHQFESDRWANFFTFGLALPSGAGMCLRRSVIERYIENLAGSPLRQKFGRAGEHLTSSEDTDLILTACDLNQAWGLFARLRLAHLIPARRLQADYLRRLAEGSFFSMILLDRIRGIAVPEEGKLKFLHRALRLLRTPAISRPIQLAAWRGTDRAFALPLSM